MDLIDEDAEAGELLGLRDAVDQLQAENKRLRERIRRCADCGGIKVETFVDKVCFHSDKSLSVFAPVHKCKDCGFQWTDDIADEIWDKTRHPTLQMEKPNE